MWISNFENIKGSNSFSKFRKVNWCILRNARHGVIRATKSSSKAP